MRIPIVIGALSLLVFFGCTNSSEQPAGQTQGEVAAPAGIPDRMIGLDQNLITDLPRPQSYALDDSIASSAEARERAWSGMPPRIPHGIADFLPITREENACLLCHDPTDKDRVPDDGKAIPESHFVDYRQSPALKRDQIVGARWDCTFCHTPSTDARPLVENDYRP